MLSLSPYTRFVVLLGIGFALINHHTTITITLQDAVSSAYRTNDMLTSLAYSYKAHRELERAVISAYLPHVSFNAQVIRKNQDSSEPIRAASWEFIQPLVNLAIVDQYYAAQEATEAVLYQQLLLNDSVRLSTEDAYFQAQKTVVQEPYIISLQGSSQRLLSQALQHFEVGFLNVPQKLESEARYAQAHAHAENYYHNYHIAQAALLQKTGININLHNLEPRTLQGFLCTAKDLSLKPIAEYRDAAQKHRKELDVLHHEMMQEHFLSRSAFHYYLPTINLFAQVTHSTFDSQDVSLAKIFGTASWQFGISMNWEFDGFNSLHTGHAAKAQALAKCFERENMKTIIQQQVDTTYYTLQTQQNFLDAAQKQYIQAKAEFARKQQQYTVGELARPEFEEAETALHQAESMLKQQALEVEQAHTHLLAACGYPKNLETQS
ncbi:TolC family protein [Candidatus Dependentiae bacterium]|nr:TolC family protein [Candidatus Dependentiae bacterium]